MTYLIFKCRCCGQREPIQNDNAEVIYDEAMERPGHHGSVRRHACSVVMFGIADLVGWQRESDTKTGD